MKTLFPRPIFTLFLYTSSKPSCYKLFQLSRFSSFSRRHEDDGRNVKVSVWWDFENCSLPPAVNVFRVAHSITTAIRANGIKGPIQITAFGDVVHLPRPNQEALSSTGISLTHIPNGGKSSADRSLLVDLMYWVSQNPPPAHLFLITADTEFAGILHRLRMNNYNILLATPENASAALFSAATIMWQWNALLTGEDLTGKHFNHPPDGPYASWYAPHYKAPLQDPFAIVSVEHPISEDPSDPKPRPIPKAVIKYIRHILASNPKGLFITDLRAELAKSNLSIDKDFYGYKKFSRFLLAMPNVLKLQSGTGSGGQLLVQSVAPKSSEQNECSSRISVEPVANVGEPDSVDVRKLNGTRSSCADGPNKIPLSTSFSVPKMETPSKLQESQKVQELTTKVERPLPKVQQSAQNTQEPTSGIQAPQGELNEPPPSSIQITETKATGSQLHTAEDESSVPKQGIFKRLWKKLFGSKEYDANEKNCSSSDKIPAEQTTIKESDVELTNQSENLKGLDPSPSGDEAKVDEKNTVSSQAIVEKPSSQSGFFNQIKIWCRSWKSLPPQNNLKFESDERVALKKPGSMTHKIFSEDSFWMDMEAFLDTAQGSTFVLQSRTRLQMAQNLQKHGPLSLKSLCESDLLHLVDLLISDKKWVEERIQRTFPFKLSRAAAKAVNNASQSSTGLSSIFLHTELPTNSTKLQEQDGEKKHQNPPHSGVSQPVAQGVSFGKSRNEVLVDCQKLVQDIVRKHPEGYNLGSFRKLFLEKYGYSLDIQKLGYQKLVNLLQIMPGIRIVSNHIIPFGKDVNSAAEELFSQESCDGGTVATFDSVVLDASRKGDDLESPWAELGPISKTTLKKDETELVSTRPSRIDYEPLSDDDFSDMDEETLSSTKRESAKPRGEEEESSLLQILDSWYSRKEESNGNGASENVDGMVKCSWSNSKPSSSSESVSKSDALVLNTGKRNKLSKAYSFVSDQPQDHKDELIDGILSSLNKSGEKSVQPKT